MGIHIGSILGTDFGNGIFPNLVAYNVSKHGQRAYNQCLFQEVNKFGIKCCCIMPGLVRTAMTSRVESNDFMDAKEISGAVKYVLSTGSDACPTDIVIRAQRAML